MYIVVFEKTQKAGPYAGARTISQWPTKEDFRKAWDEAWTDEEKSFVTILKEGATDEEAQSLCSAVDLSVYARIIVAKATLPSGKIDPEILERETIKFGVALAPETAE